VKRIVRRLVVASAVGCAALAAAPAFAGTPTPVIDVVDSQFRPATSPSVTTVQEQHEFAWLEDDTNLRHNVNQDDRLFRSGAPRANFGQYTEDISAGTYHYYCQMHGSRAGGMDGVVRVRPDVTPGNGASAMAFWADPQAEAKHRFAVQFRRLGATRWRTWKRGAAGFKGNFGLNDNPINANPTVTYQLRARTFVKGDRDRRSGWSQPESFDVAEP
jgi:plastocyanin